MINEMNQVLKDAALEPVQSASVTISRTELNSPQAVQRAVESFVGAEGWLCLTDEVLVVKKNKPLPALKDRIILSGELVMGETSIHIRQDGSKWEQYTLKRYEGGEQIVVEERFLSTPKGEQCRLKYEVFWQVDATGALSPYASRFAGFEQGGIR